MGNEVFFMSSANNSKPTVLRMVMLAMMVAIGVVISPILRVEGMCPMAHLINITVSVLMGPWYSLLCAVMIGVIRMLFMGIPPLALTGAVFGAFLSGVLYRVSGGKLIFAWLGEIIGTGIIGAIVSYPVMTYLVGRTWSDLDVLRSFLYRRHTDRRSHRLCIPEGTQSKSYAGTDSVCAWSKGL